MVPIMQVGATDSAQLRAKGVQAYDIGTVMGMEDLKRIHGNDERIQIAHVIDEAISDVRLARLAETDQIGRDAARDRRHPRNDVAPDKG